MSRSADTRSRQRELAHRNSDGIEVVLFWHDGTRDLMVAVSDGRSGAYFELAAHPNEALDVFEHPFAYAAFRGLPYERALLPCWTAGAVPASELHEYSEKPTR